MKTLEQFLFSPNVTPKEKISISIYLYFNSFNISEVPLSITYERCCNIDNLIDTQSKWIKTNLNLNINNRIPKRDKINFYVDEEFQKISIKENLSLGISGVCYHPYNQILIREAPTENETMRILAHELIHAYSSQVISFVKEGNNIKHVKSKIMGYSNDNNVFRYFDEVLTEMMTVEISDTIRKRNGKDYITNIPLGYGTDLLLFDLIFSDAANALSIGQKQLRHLLYHGYLVGDHSSLRVFDKVFGKDTLRVIAYFDTKNIINSGVNLIKRCGGIGLSNRLDAKSNLFLEGKEFEILGGIKLKCPL